MQMSPLSGYANFLGARGTLAGRAVSVKSVNASLERSEVEGEFSHTQQRLARFATVLVHPIWGGYLKRLAGLCRAVFAGRQTSDPKFPDWTGSTRIFRGNSWPEPTIIYPGYRRCP